MSFHGSYREEDVEFLLKPVPIPAALSVLEKERLIQSGERHYSQMLTPETLPPESYRALFFEAYQLNRARMARDCLLLAELICRDTVGRPTLVSLARAGTPIGVIVFHLLKKLGCGPAGHYSISVVRDIGVDVNAIDEILARGTNPRGIVFVDGWTGKGVIGRELDRGICRYNESRGTNISSRLYVLADLAGTAYRAATRDDYLIPSAILNATISGLVSRSVINESIGAGDFHGCVRYSEFAAEDLSVWFVDEIVQLAMELVRSGRGRSDHAPASLGAAPCGTAFVEREMKRYGVSDSNLVKPGIGEATRVLLRRTPELLVVRDRALPSVRHLIALSDEKSVRVEERPALEIDALAVIRSTLDA